MTVEQRKAHDATRATEPIDRILTALSGGVNWRLKRPDANPERPTMTALTINEAAHVACASTWISQCRIHLRRRWPHLDIVCDRSRKPPTYRIEPSTARVGASPVTAQLGGPATPATGARSSGGRPKLPDGAPTSRDRVPVASLRPREQAALFPASARDNWPESRRS